MEKEQTHVYQHYHLQCYTNYWQSSAVAADSACTNQLSHLCSTSWPSSPVLISRTVKILTLRGHHLYGSTEGQWREINNQIMNFNQEQKLKSIINIFQDFLSSQIGTNQRSMTEKKGTMVILLLSEFANSKKFIKRVNKYKLGLTRVKLRISRSVHPTWPAQLSAYFCQPKVVDDNFLMEVYQSISWKGIISPHQQAVMSKLKFHIF